jgi:hypothetical protein
VHNHSRNKNKNINEVIINYDITAINYSQK